MELITCTIPKSSRKLVIAPLGDIQWNGPKGPTAQGHLKRHIDHCLALGAYFVGTGDYVDFISPSNRRRLIAADLYDTARDSIVERALELNDELFEKFLKPTKGRWLGMVEGHHFYEADGQTSDQLLAEKLATKFLGTSAFIRINSADFTLYVNHSVGGASKLPGTALNKAYHLAAGLQGADVYLLGHDTKVATTRLSRPFPDWQTKMLTHRDIWLVNCGSFCRSNIVGHRHGRIPRGDYAEQGLLTPSPLSAPIITVDLVEDHDRIRVSI